MACSPPQRQWVIDHAYPRKPNSFWWTVIVRSLDGRETHVVHIRVSPINANDLIPNMYEARAKSVIATLIEQCADPLTLDNTHH